MKFLHQPKAIRNEKPIDWRQNKYTALYKDIPASQIPDGAVSEADNVLLFGEQWYVRPGQQRVSTLTIPQVTYYNAVSKTGDLITSTAEEFATDCVGNFFVWGNGQIDHIIARNTSLIVQVDNSTSTAPYGVGYVRGRLNASFWWEKSKTLFCLFDKLIYYTSNFTAWTQVYPDSGIALVNTKSEFYLFEDSIYLRNEGGIIRIDTAITPYRAIKINQTSPPNTIVVNTDQSSYPPTDEESSLNKYGRRYLFSMAALDGDLTNNRGDGTRIIKETGTNTTTAANDYRDYIESWRFNYWGTGESSYTATSIVQTDVSSQIIYNWLESSEGGGGFGLTVGGIERDVIWTSVISAATDGWAYLAELFQEGMRRAFPEYPYMQCVFDADNLLLLFISGQGDVDITAIGYAANTNVYDFWSDQVYFTNSNTTSPSLTTTNSIGTAASPALQVPSGQYGWTHYPVYSTKTLGVDFPNADNERFIWQADVKIVSVFRLTITGTAAVVQDSLGAFADEDVGCELHLQTELNTLTAVTINQVTDVDNAVLEVGITGPSTTWAAIGVQSGGTDTIKSATIVGDTCTETTGDYLVAGDLYKTAYWDTGEIGMITSIDIDAHTFACTNTPTSGEHGYVIEPYGRNYNDVISDEKLTYREIDYICINRFLTALPEGQLMSLVPGFMVVSDVDASKYYYCNFNIINQYLAGHYNATYQFDIVKDNIKALVEMPNQLIIWCSNSTWRVQTNISETLADDRTGESISILTGLGVIEKYIGIADRSCVTDFATGQKAVITREPGIRLFDGYRYSENKLYDGNGNSFINTEFEQLKDEMLAYYEPNLYGLMIFGSTTSYSKFNGSYTKSDTCWRMAVENQQGFGFSKLSGDDFPFPELGGGIIKITTNNHNSVTLMIDARKGIMFYLSTRKLPSIESINFSMVDMRSQEDTEITWTLGLREHTFRDENEKLEYLEEYWYFRPYNESDKDASGYDSYGFRDAQVLTSKIYIDGEETNASEITSENPLATIYQPYSIQARRIKVEMSGTASSIRGVGNRAVYKPLIRREEPPNVINDRTYQRELSANRALWVTRGESPLVNLITGSDPDTSQTITESSGPDAITTETVTIDGTSYSKDTNTAFLISGTDAIEYEEMNLGTGTTRSVAFSFYASATTDGIVTLYQEGDGSLLNITFEYASGVGSIKYYNDGSEMLSIDITVDKWYHFYVGYSKTYLLDVDGIVESHDYGHEVTGTQSSETVYIRGQGTGDTQVILHDIRIYKAAISYGAIVYLNRDIYTRYGKSLLPAFSYTYS